MELHFEALALTLKTTVAVPYGLTDANLFQVVKNNLVTTIENIDQTFDYFGYAPDNDADGQEELLQNGTFYRIIAPDYLLGIDTDATLSEIKKAFLDLLNLNLSCWCSIFTEEAGTAKQTTIEILFKE